MILVHFSSQACTCDTWMDEASKAINLKSSDAGFTAKVTQILKPALIPDSLPDSIQQGTIVIVTIESTIKGKVKKGQQILILQDGSNCDYTFRLNEFVEIYGDNSKKNHPYLPLDNKTVQLTQNLIAYETSQCSTYSIKK